MTEIRVSTTVEIVDSIGRHVATVINSATANPGANARFYATFARGAIQSTEHQIAAALIAQFGDKPDTGPLNSLRESLGMDGPGTGTPETRRARQIEANTHALRAERMTLPEPFAQGHVVELSSGEYAGRRGRISETQHAEGFIPTATIELDPPGQPLNPSEPIVVTGVQFNSIEAVY